MLENKDLILIFCLFALTGLNCESNDLTENDMINGAEKQISFKDRIIADKSSVGQIGGIDTDSSGNLVVFHRAYRKWSFEFFMPHGLTIDHKNNIWLTDVALHQVFKFNLEESNEPLLTLGKPFVKSNNKNNFCKPTSVAISEKNEDIFIADGYCNSRVIQFDKSGKFIKEFKDLDEQLIVVHSVALLEESNLVCTVSRQEGRIVCFDVESGAKKFTITNEFMKTVYAIKYDKLNQVIHAVTGSNDGLPSYGLTFDAKLNNFGKFIQKWESKNGSLSDAHDIAISPDASKIYVGQLNGEIDEFIFK